MKKIVFLLTFLLTGIFGYAQRAEVKKSKRLIAVDHATEAMAPIEAAIRENPKEADLY